MTETGRDAIFISHANPEDNAFTVWLGARLTEAGYGVWADVLRLRGGQNWQRRLEDALRNCARKVLLVGTNHGAEKQGVRNEIQVAHNVGRKIGDAEFVIPLRVTDFDAPFLVAHAQYIDFKRSWADGLAELLETLEETYRVPRRRDSAGETMDYWREVHVRHGQLLKAKSEPLVSNWVAVERLPETISLYDFRGGISIGAAQRQMKDAKRPLAPFRRGFLAFCPLYDLQDHFGPSLPLEVVDEVDTHEFLDDGWPAQDIGKWDAHNQFSNLVRQAMEFTLRGRGLSAYELATTQLAWWGKVGAVPSGQVRFSWEGGPKGRRQLVGFSEKRGLHWHYGVTPKPRVYPFPHVRLVNRVIFTEDGVVPVDSPKRMHRLRRSFTKSWRNAKWRDMLMAFLHWLAEGETSLGIAVGSDTAMSLRVPPLTFTGAMSVVVGDDDEEEWDTDDELASEGDEYVDVDDFDDDDGQVESDEQDERQEDEGVAGEHGEERRDFRA